MEAFDALVPPLLEAFQPDVLATQLGIDTHFKDPLTHLALTSHGYLQVAERLGDMGYPWLAFGGGGYYLSTVARCWALAYGVMLGHQWPGKLPPVAPEALDGSTRLHDEDTPPENDALQRQAREFAYTGVQALRRTKLLTAHKP